MYSRFFALFCIFVALVSALPSQQVASLTASAAALASPTSFTTVQTVNGTVTETCVITLTPVGNQIQEVQNCTTATASAATTPSSTASPMMAAAAFAMPGTSIQVLPVGLGVYGGITAIGIVFVAFVTWERVQYRKAFRRQRVVEASAFGMIKG